MTSPRPLLALAGGVLLVILASLGGVAYVTLRTRPLAERLARDVEALAQARYPRPSHVTPALPGTFGEHLAPLMDELLRVSDARLLPLMELSAESPCSDAFEGRETLSAMPARCREPLETDRELLLTALEATHAESGGLPEVMRAMASPPLPNEPSAYSAMNFLLRLAALETQLRVEQGRAAEAVDTCLDALALSRELMLGGGLEGHMVGAIGYNFMYRPCAAALDAAPQERKRTAAAQLSRLAEGFVPLSRSLREEAVKVQLTKFGTLLPAELLAGLPESARTRVSTSIEGFDPERVLDSRLAWHKTVKTFDALVKVADQPAAARRKGITAVAAWAKDELYSVDAPKAENYQQYADRAELLRVQHDALMALAEADLKRKEDGRWPERVTLRTGASFVVESTDLGEARLKPCAPELEDQSLRVTADGPPGGWVRQTP
ncbi:hypothetical protein JY651_34500 [Pyxidicoccus parkwayensis]|uniref:Uncharacterized protein n=1 Tax=Pyxidicoccus parkwayensis TaxID=2813578 RepID=A0ABX7NPH6_9BACT|nr:hypothetical protein [Pyxidicoccus parkwaysis]QSQ20338.1 hypothetical protein JY651_34500 [Pyxidicoccus parkwaysis]